MLHCLRCVKYVLLLCFFVYTHALHVALHVWNRTVLRNARSKLEFLIPVLFQRWPLSDHLQSCSVDELLGCAMVLFLHMGILFSVWKLLCHLSSYCPLQLHFSPHTSDSHQVMSSFILFMLVLVLLELIEWLPARCLWFFCNLIDMFSTGFNICCVQEVATNGALWGM